MPQPLTSLALALLCPLQGTPPSPALGGTEGPDLTRYLLVCAGLLLLVGGLAWAARRFLSGTLKARAARRAMQVVDVLPLGGRQRLAVVRCYDRTFLLGLGDKEVSLVTELDGAIGPPAPEEGTSVEARSFADVLVRAHPRSTPVAAPRPAAAPARARLEREGILG
jgi:flagellar biosynthetic protein FliO